MGKLPHSELSPAEKICIQEWVRTHNASQSFEKAFPGKFADHKDANRRMQQLLMKPLANEYQKSIREEVEQQTNISKDWLIKEIIQLKEQSTMNMDYSSSVKCLFLLAKMMGYMSKQVIDVKKTVQISFGGGFNPENNLIATNYSEVDNVQFLESDNIQINDEDTAKDDSKIDDY